MESLLRDIWNPKHNKPEKCRTWNAEQHSTNLSSILQEEGAKISYWQKIYNCSKCTAIDLMGTTTVNGGGI
jgi:hypothetical protein